MLRDSQKTSGRFGTTILASTSAHVLLCKSAVEDGVNIVEMGRDQSRSYTLCLKKRYSSKF